MSGHKQHIKHVICTNHTSHKQHMYGIVLFPQSSQPSQFWIMWRKCIALFSNSRRCVTLNCLSDINWQQLCHLNLATIVLFLWLPLKEHESDIIMCVSGPKVSKFTSLAWSQVDTSQNVNNPTSLHRTELHTTIYSLPLPWSQVSVCTKTPVPKTNQYSAQCCKQKLLAQLGYQYVIISSPDFSFCSPV